MRILTVNIFLSYKHDGTCLHIIYFCLRSALYIMQTVIALLEHHVPKKLVCVFWHFLTLIGGSYQHH